VAHVGTFPELEDELVEFSQLTASGGRSPDRADALVWAVSELMLGKRAAPRLRFV
jgi:phage terminase large subunit-like protein